MGLFKIKYYMASPINDTNSVFVEPIIGLDTYTGFRNAPYATLTKAITAFQSGHRILKGITTENVTPYANIPSQYLIGENGSGINGTVILQGGYDNNINHVYNLALKIVTMTAGRLERCTIENISGYNTIPSNGAIGGISNCFILSSKLASYADDIRTVFTNNTIYDFFNYHSYGGYKLIYNSLFIGSVDLYNYTSRATITNYPIFKNCLFRKATLWKWNGATIAINWTNNPVGGAAYTNETLMTRVYNSLLYYANNTVAVGTDRTYAQAILATLETMFKSCAIYDDSDSVNSPIFNRYVDGVPVDYTLSLKSNNPALNISNANSYVGCYSANLNDDGAGNPLTFGVVKHVNTADGLDTGTTPNLLIQDVSNPSKFSASQSSAQLWNRIRTSVVAYPRGKSFAGMQSQLDSGIASRLFFGKLQEIVTTGDINLKTTAFESVEVIPYDSIPANNNTTQNTISNLSVLLPRFSAPFNGDCLIFYKAGVPLIFNNLLNLFQGAGTVSITSGSPTVTGVGTAFLADYIAGDNIRIGGVDYTVLTTPTTNTALTLTANVGVTLSGQTYFVGVKTDKNLTIYGTWVVSNADYESYSLYLKATKAGLTASIPLIKWCKFELNLHYDEI